MSSQSPESTGVPRVTRTKRSLRVSGPRGRQRAPQVRPSNLPRPLQSLRLPPQSPWPLPQSPAPKYRQLDDCWFVWTSISG